MNYRLLPGGHGQPIAVLSRTHREAQGRFQLGIERAARAVPRKVPVPALYGGSDENVANDIGNDGSDVLHGNPLNETEK